MALVLFVHVTASSAPVSTEESVAKPNIVVILADDIGYGDLGCYGAIKVQTPNLDGLEQEGRRFTDAHTVSAVCTPSRYALLTGEYAWRKNIWSPVFHTAGALIGTEQMTVGRLLQQQEYATACIGKWHLGFGTSDRCDPSARRCRNAAGY